MIKRVSEKEIFKTKLFTIKDVLIQVDEGKIHTFQVMEKRDTAMIVPITNDNKIIFVREYFAAIDAYQLSLPKGRIDEGHDALVTASKEIQEEMGYKDTSLVKIVILTMS